MSTLKPFVIREADVKPFISEPPEHRSVKILLSPYLHPVHSSMSFGLVEVPPGHRSPYHNHEIEQEFWYVVSGTGQIRVEEEYVEVEPGTVVVAPAKSMHQLINTGTEVLKAVLALTPPGPEMKNLPK